MAWREGALCGVPLDRPATAIFATYTHVGMIPNQPLPQGQWITIDLSNGPQWVFQQPNLPEDTIAVLLSGLLVITNTTSGIANLTAAFRPAGGTLNPGNYQMQAMAIPGDGARSNAAVMVPVVNRKFEFYWTYTEGCPSIINLTIQQYIRAGGGPVVPPPSESKWFRICEGDPLVCYEGSLTQTGGA